MNPFYTISDENPNEIHGVRACTAAGQQKSRDCAGLWYTQNNVRAANPLAPYVTICSHHLQEMAAADDSGSMRLGYAAPPQEGKPKPRVKVARGRDELSL